MKITGLEVVPFETFVDRISFGQLMTDYRVVQTVTKVLTDEGARAATSVATSTETRMACCPETRR